jgi:hypothetical protein
MIGEAGIPLPQISPIVSLNDTDLYMKNGFVEIGATPEYFVQPALLLSEINGSSAPKILSIG